MNLTSIITLFGGLGAFLFGMHYMGEGLQLAAGTRMKNLLEKLTRNPVIGFLVGMVVTVVIQSSAATTVMVMGFINAGIMDLAQATGVIFGANIGTTITSILIALDVSAIAPVCIAAGALLMLYAKRKKTRYFGQILLGFGMLFQGLHTMSGAMAPLKDSPRFTSFIVGADNPFLGFLIGALMCAVLQSSSAAVGIVQALAMQGLMPLGFAAFLVCGINVGSSTPPLMSALKARHNAQRAALIYLIFNVVGAVIFMPVVIFTPLVEILGTKIPSPAFQVSAFHILFKVVTGLILLPLVNQVVKLTYRIIPVRAHESEMRLKYIDKNMIGSPAVVTVQVGKEVDRMASLAADNLKDAGQGLIDGSCEKAQKIRDNEEVIDFLAGEITDYLSKVSSLEMAPEIAEYLSCVYHAINDLEQIGDHCVKILAQNEKNEELGKMYSPEAQKELQEILDEDLRLLAEAADRFLNRLVTIEQWGQMQKGVRKIARLVSEAQSNHMDRLRRQVCSFDQGLTFMESINSFSRIVNHISNLEEVVIGAEVRAGLPQGSGN